MDKPVSLKVQEVEQKIVNTINESALPAFCIKVVLQNLYRQIDVLDKQEIQEYQEKTKKEQDEKSKGD